MGTCQTISKMSTLASLNIKSEIVFTRYLYLKDEVKLSLLVALLNKKDSALYWAYELYYSGFEEELFQHLWKIYYDFYYTLNPSFQDYFVKKYKEWKKPTTKDKERFVAFIIGDLMIRPHNLDVFMLRQSIHYSKEEFTSQSISTYEFSEILETQNYLQIANFILGLKTANIQIIKETVAHFVKKGIKMDEEKIIKRWKKISGFLKMDESVQILAFIMHQFSQLTKIQMGKKLYIIVEKEDILGYDTIFNNSATNFRCYKILPLAYLYTIDEDNYLSLFQLERNKILMDDPDGLRKIYGHHWEYYASFSPLWFERIQKCKGKHNHETKRIEFPENEETDWTEEFYSNFGYEPDEQKREIQEKSIQKIEKLRTWKQFFEEHGKKGIFVPSDSTLSEFKNIKY